MQYDACRRAVRDNDLISCKSRQIYTRDNFPHMDFLKINTVNLLDEMRFWKDYNIINAFISILSDTLVSYLEMTFGLTFTSSC